MPRKPRAARKIELPEGQLPPLREVYPPRSIALGPMESCELYWPMYRKRVFYLITKKGEFLLGDSGKIVMHSFEQAVQLAERLSEDFIMSVWDRHVLYAVRRPGKKTQWLRAVVFPHEIVENTSNIVSHQERELVDSEEFYNQPEK